ncbi:uncharacterized protein SETTUDRAFT_161119 [Exserohilum turcica Et28A]|uniref:Uncharacterized protein n=1 Tax=Exserohilum turcicum (strain 28A) TaxID=671987 RepID=R0IRU4_EXST2|nr:uncharacterized protein SETTUDRAFT_161119 [Exserohilum turcica Et28A]EOA87585.1 hypothetical protein SETTUDRAFT_161119 [Exserohilum turcica Et28A]
MNFQSSVIWPPPFLPRITNNFLSNERIAKYITCTQIWSLLANISTWESNNSQFLHKDEVSKFSTFGCRPLACTTQESEAPKSNGRAGRLSWCTKTPDGLEVYHAWLFKDLESQRVRVLTRESQIRAVFKELEAQTPNSMLLGHQDWLDGLITAARVDRRISEKLSNEVADV